jgi:dephospho-CoA kinase
MPLFLFGLTGGIGSGKSSVAERFRARGVPIIDADALAREVVKPGSEGLAEIVATFGEEMVDDEGALRRPRLAQKVFADPAERKKLEAITHPLVRRLAQARFAELQARGEALAGYEVPLFYEVGLDREIAPVVVVTARPEQQLERAMRRDGATPNAILARIAAQIPLEEKARRADFVVDNSGSPSETMAAADRVLDELRVLSSR